MIRESSPRFRRSEKDQEPEEITLEVGRYQVKERIWVEGASGTFLGCGRVTLLERIAKYGSISKAARSMAMSCRYAWERTIPSFPTWT